MRLNKSLRWDFVRAAMNDVPSVDYKEKIVDEVRRLSEAYLPEELRKHLKTENEIYLNIWCSTIYVSDRSGGTMSLTVAGYGKTQAQVTTLAKELGKKYLKVYLEQEAKLKQLRRELTAHADSCMTTQQLEQTLPEFKVYIPKEPPRPKPRRDLPVATNVVTSFMKAGWPKGKKKEAQRARA